MQRVSLSLLLLMMATPPVLALPAVRDQPVAHQRLLDAAATALFAAHGGGIDARPVGDAEAELAVPAGKVSLKARVPEGAVLSRRMVVNVDVDIDGRHWRTVPVWFAVQAWRAVWVARTPLKPGQLADTDAFTPERRDVTALASPPLAATQPLDGLRLRGPLAPGAVLTAAQVETRPAVARQQSVSVKVNAGPVELQTVGVALSDGRIGEVVRVLNPESMQSYAARVVADGLVVAGER